MKIPNRLKALGMNITILRPDMVVVGADNCAGSWDSINLIIEIKDGLPPDAAEAVFFHELLHVADFNDALNEDQVKQISRALYAIFKDNHLLKE